jgi:hypothetical protein
MYDRDQKSRYSVIWNLERERAVKRWRGNLKEARKKRDYPFRWSKSYLGGLKLGGIGAVHTMALTFANFDGPSAYWASKHTMGIEGRRERALDHCVMRQDPFTELS